MLKPRLCDSPPVFQKSRARLAPVLSLLNCAANDCNRMLVGAVMISVCVEELLVRIGSVWSALTVAVFIACPCAPARVTMVTVAVAALAMVPSRQVTVPPACEQVPVVEMDDR